MFVYGFCNLDKVPETLEGLRDFDRLRSHTNHPGVLALGGYSNARSAALGDPCDRLKELGLLDRFRVTTASWQAVAVGNLDEDPDLEVWSVDQHKNLERVARD